MSTPKFRKREKEVVELLLEGKSNKQIAQKLGISIRTVEFHLSNIYARLDARSRTEAVIKLTEMNLRKSAGRNTGRVLRKSTVARKNRSAENGGNQTKRSFPMKNLLIGLAIGVTVTIIVAFAFTYINGNGPGITTERTTATIVPWETATPVPFDASPIPSGNEGEEQATAIPALPEPTGTPFPTQQS